MSDPEGWIESQVAKGRFVKFWSERVVPYRDLAHVMEVFYGACRERPYVPLADGSLVPRPIEQRSIDAQMGLFGLTDFDERLECSRLVHALDAAALDWEKEDLDDGNDSDPTATN